MCNPATHGLLAIVVVAMSATLGACAHQTELSSEKLAAIRGIRVGSEVAEGDVPRRNEMQMTQTAIASGYGAAGGAFGYLLDAGMARAAECGKVAEASGIDVNRLAIDRLTVQSRLHKAFGNKVSDDGEYLLRIKKLTCNFMPKTLISDDMRPIIFVDLAIADPSGKEIYFATGHTPYGWGGSTFLTLDAWKADPGRLREELGKAFDVSFASALGLEPAGTDVARK